MLENVVQNMQENLSFNLYSKVKFTDLLLAICKDIHREV